MFWSDKFAVFWPIMSKFGSLSSRGLKPFNALSIEVQHTADERGKFIGDNTGWSQGSRPVSTQISVAFSSATDKLFAFPGVLLSCTSVGLLLSTMGVSCSGVPPVVVVTDPIATSFSRISGMTFSGHSLDEFP